MLIYRCFYIDSGYFGYGNTGEKRYDKYGLFMKSVKEIMALIHTRLKQFMVQRLMKNSRSRSNTKKVRGSYEGCRRSIAI